MPGLYRGTTRITKVYRGATPINKMYRGATLIFTTAVIRDDFNRPDSSDINATLGTAAWTRENPGDDYPIGVSGQQARVALPDGLISTAWLTRRIKHNTLMPADDGYLEVRAGSKGSTDPDIAQNGFASEMFCRAPNASYTDGVGIRVKSGDFYLVSRTANTVTSRVTGGPFQAGDVFRMTFSGYLYSLYRNGAFVGEWNDTGHISFRDAGHRALFMRQDARKDFLGPRRFSPTFDYIEAA
jgi:hypothetical protein